MKATYKANGQVKTLCARQAGSPISETMLAVGCEAVSIKEDGEKEKARKYKGNEETEML